MHGASSLKQSASPAVRTLVHTLLVPGVSIVIVPWILHSHFAAFPLRLGVGRLAGVAPLAAGAILYARAAARFVRSGRGTPWVLDPPERLVRDGPYARVRNPLYLAVTLAFVGEALLLDSAALLVYALTLFVGLHVRVAYFEEPRLVRRFGTEYERYRKNVPRWRPLTGRVR